MKKTVALLLLMTMMLTLCAACGGSKEEASAPTAAPAAAAPEVQEEDLPTVQRNTGAADADQNDNGMIAAEDNRAAGATVNTDWLSTLSEEQRYVEENLIGAPIEDLLDYLGEPKSEEYTTTCLGHDGWDGILWYDGFIVSTTRYSNGTEVILGTEEN